MACAYSSELPRYGLSVGLKNYPACYCTGLLVARRLLTSLGLDKIYPGVNKVTGEITKTVENKVTYFVPKVDEKKRPFKCSLDVGIRRTTTGCRIFGALKGAVDGGLNIPHSEKRFPGYNSESKSYDPKIHREKIFGKNISKYMKALEKDDKEKYNKLFADYIKNGIKADGLEALYTKVHEAIRKDPTSKPKAVKDYKNAKFANKPKKSAAQFNDRIKQKKASYEKRTAVAAKQINNAFCFVDFLNRQNWGDDVYCFGFYKNNKKVLNNSCEKKRIYLQFMNKRCFYLNIEYNALK